MPGRVIDDEWTLSAEVSLESLGSTSLIHQLTTESSDGLYLPYRDSYLDPDEFLRAVLHIHFHEQYGAPYWQEAAKRLSFDPRSEIKSMDDLAKLPTADEVALQRRPVTDFVPQLYTSDQLDLSKSSGTTGSKKVMPWTRTMSEETGRWYEWNLRQRGTDDGDWLVVGPYGLYEKHLERAANRLGGSCHFTAIEPKGIKRQIQALGTVVNCPWRIIDPRLSIPALRGQVRMRVMVQAVVDDLRSQPVRHIASAAPIIERLHEHLVSENTVSAPEDIETILLSGMNIDEGDLTTLGRLYSNATLIPMYATSFTGATFPTPDTDDVAYYPMAPAAWFDVIEPATERRVAFGTRGQVVIHRLGEDFFWPNQLERETAVRVSSPKESAIDWSGIADIEPL